MAVNFGPEHSNAVSWLIPGSGGAPHVPKLWMIRWLAEGKDVVDYKAQIAGERQREIKDRAAAEHQARLLRPDVWRWLLSVSSCCYTLRLAVLWENGEAEGGSSQVSGLEACVHHIA